MLQIDKNVFDPALLSFPDCDYLLAYAGQPPVVVLGQIPSVANRGILTQWIERFYELEELKKARGYEWVGVDAIKAAINKYLEVRAQWKRDEAHGAPKNPSLYAFDTRGNAHEGAPGSDSGRVRTYFDDNGNRIPFAIHIVEAGVTGAWKPSWIAKKSAEQVKAEVGTAPQAKFEILEPEGKNCIECGVPGCGHTETFKPESRSSRNSARARMSRHLRNSKIESQAHLELHTLEFGSASTK
jgi:hypothetical protein